MFVSVIIPAYNAEAYLRMCIESVLGQTHKDFELILIDDGSSDATLEICHHFEELDDRVRVFTHENKGVANTLNDGIHEARSDWIAIMHADDVMERNRLERQLAFFAEHPDLAVASSFVTYKDHQGRTIGHHSSALTTDEAVERTRESEIIIGFHHPAVMMRKAAAIDAGLYRQEFWPAEDLDLWNRIADRGGRILVQPERLVRYRIHEEAASVREAALVRHQLNWIKACTLARRQGIPEPSAEEFDEFRRTQPVLTRVNNWRADMSQTMYKQGAFSYSIGRRVRTVLLLVGSSLLDPFYAPGQIWRKFLKSKIRGEGA